jgi:hypothetical protein
VWQVNARYIKLTQNLTHSASLIPEEKRLNSNDKSKDDIDISVCEKVSQLLVAG